MSEEADFLAQILAEPDEEAPRMIYADWLEELGDPRGEFIRLQCQRAHLPVNHPEQLGMIHRQQELIKEHGEERLGGSLPKEVQAMHKSIRKIRTHRGFVEKISLTARQYARFAERILKLIPLRAVKVDTIGGLTETPQLKRLREVEAHQAHDLLKFVRSSFITNLKTLIVKSSLVDVAQLEALVSSPHLRGLEEVVFGSISAGDLIADFLAGATELLSLRTIRMNYCQLTYHALQSLLASRTLDLERLDISGNWLGRQAIESITNAEHFSHIRVLDLGDNDLKNEGVRSLVDAVTDKSLVGIKGSSLQQLHLQCNSLTDESCVALASWPCLQQLELLDLRTNPIGYAGVEEIAEAQKDRDRPALVLLDHSHVNAQQLKALQDKYGPYYRRQLNEL